MRITPSRLRIACRALYWMARVEAVIRRRRIDSLATTAGITFATTPPDGRPVGGSTSTSVVLSRDQDFALRLVRRLYARWPGGGTCLRECLVAGRLLRERRPVLRVGVQSEAGAYSMHAWLEFDGVAFDPMAPAFAPLVAGSSTAR